MSGTKNSIITPQVPVSSGAISTLANTNYAAPTTAVVIFTAGPNGDRVVGVSALAVATVTLTDLQLYRDSDGTGTLKRLYRSRVMSAFTVSPTVKQTEVDFDFSDTNPILLAPNEKLYGAIGVAQTGITWSAQGGDL